MIYEKIGIWKFQSFVYRFLCLVLSTLFFYLFFVLFCALIYNKGLNLFAYLLVTWKLGTDEDTNIFYYLIPLLSFLNVDTWNRLFWTGKRSKKILLKQIEKAFSAYIVIKWRNHEEGCVFWKENGHAKIGWMGSDSHCQCDALWGIHFESNIAQCSCNKFMYVYII